MKVAEIYEKFGIPPNLQEHMLKVCGIVEFVQKHWSGKDIVDWDLIKKIALLHDLGNIVKFDFDKHPEFLGEEQANVEHWKQIQNKVVTKYGSDDHEATEKMLKEIGLKENAIEIILDKSFGNSIETRNSNNWPLKVLYYADLRTLPFGIGTLEERITDVKDRIPKYSNRPDFNDLVEACREIEKQIQNNLNVPVGNITDDVVKVNNSLLNLEV